MTLPAGQISLGEVNVELGLSSTTTISLNQANVRALAGVPSGQIAMSNLQGKSSVSYFIATVTYAGNDNLYMAGLASDSSNNFYSVGSIAYSPPSGTPYGIYINQFNASGTIQYQKYLAPGNGYTSAGGIGGIYVDSSSNIYAVGTVTNSNNSTNGGYLIKLNSGLSIQWQNTLGTGTDMSYSDVKVDSSGNVYACGSIDSGTLAILVKYNSSGVLQWQRRINSAYTAYNSLSLDSTASNIYVIGYKQGTSPGWIVLKYNSSGTIQWQRQTDTSDSVAYGSVVDSSNNLYVCGFSNDDNTARLLKSNSSATVQWYRRLANTTAGYRNIYYDVCVDSSDNVYAVGSSTQSSVGILVKYNSSGTLQWQRQISTTAAGGVVLYECFIAPNGALCVGGETRGSPAYRDLVYFNLPTDGSKTGTYTVGGINFTYSVSTRTETSPSTALNSSSYTLDTPTYSLSSTTFTVGTTTYPTAATTTI